MAGAIERGARVVEIDAVERGREPVRVALATDLAVADDVDAGRLLRADRERSSRRPAPRRGTPRSTRHSSRARTRGGNRFASPARSISQSGCGMLPTTVVGNSMSSCTTLETWDRSKPTTRRSRTRRRRTRCRRRLARAVPERRSRAVTRSAASSCSACSAPAAWASSTRRTTRSSIARSRSSCLRVDARRPRTPAPACCARRRRWRRSITRT